MRQLVNRSAGLLAFILLSLTLTGCFQPVGAALEPTTVGGVGVPTFSVMVPSETPLVPTETPAIIETPAPLPTETPTEIPPELPTETPAGPETLFPETVFPEFPTETPTESSLIVQPPPVSPEAPTIAVVMLPTTVPQSPQPLPTIAPTLTPSITLTPTIDPAIIVAETLAAISTATAVQENIQRTVQAAIDANNATSAAQQTLAAQQAQQTIEAQQAQLTAVVQGTASAQQTALALLNPTATPTPTLFIPTFIPVATIPPEPFTFPPEAPTATPQEVAAQVTPVFPTSDVQETLNAQATQIIAIVTATAAANLTETATAAGVIPQPTDIGAPPPTLIPGLPTIDPNAQLPQFGTPGARTPPPGTPGTPGSGAAGPITPDCRYTVVPGDRLLRIALRFNTSPSTIARVNGIINANLLNPGQVLRIPNCGIPSETPLPTATPTESPTLDPNATIIIVTATPVGGGSGRIYVVQPGDTLFRIANRFGVSIVTLARANGITNYNVIYIGQRLTIP